MLTTTYPRKTIVSGSIFFLSFCSITLSGNKSSFIVGKQNSAITVNVKSSEIGIKAAGTANDTINLKQTVEKWTSEYQAINKGNNGTGATEALVADMTPYLKHDLSLNLGQGTDTIQGSSGNDALFLQNFGTTGDALFFQDAGIKFFLQSYI